ELQKLKKILGDKCKLNKINLDNPLLNELVNKNYISNEIDLEIKKINLLLTTIKSNLIKKKGERKKLKEAQIGLERHFEAQVKSFQEFYQEILNNKLNLRDQINQLQIDNEGDKKFHLEIEESLDNLSDILKKIITNLEILNHLKPTLITHLNELISKGHQYNPDQKEEKEIKFDSLEQFKKEIVIKIDEKNELINRIEENNSEIQDFIKQIHKLNEQRTPYMNETNLNEFIENFSYQNIFEISSYCKKMTKRLEQLRALIKAPKERMQNIVETYAGILDDILTKIKSIQRVKLPVPQLPHLDNKKILKIPIKSDDGIKGSVHDYFTELFNKFETFPAELTKEEIVDSILENFLQIRLKNITFLFPEKRPVANYQPISKLIASSGGEKLTLAIMLYCLIAHFRLRYLMGNNRQKISFPLIMDDPIGTASRPDLIKMQVSLAKHLKIQLIPFTHISEIEALRQFYNFISLRRTHFKEGNVKISIEKEEEVYMLEGGAVSVRPKARPYFENIDKFFGENQ
ncbi:MAG: hypothetical protein ACFFCM_22130, partial [Promethearchaeota archaeon]